MSPRLRMDGDPLHVAVAVAPDLRPGAGATHERVVGRHTPVVMQPDHLAVMIRQILRGMRLELAFRRYLAVAERQEQVAVAVESDLAAEMVAPFRHRFEELLDARQRGAVEAAAYQCRRRLGVSCARLRKTQINQTVRREVGMRHDFEQSALRGVKHLRNAVHRLRHQLPLTQDAETSGPFGDQGVTAGKERD